MSLRPRDETPRRNAPAVPIGVPVVSAASVAVPSLVGLRLDTPTPAPATGMNDDVANVLARYSQRAEKRPANATPGPAAAGAAQNAAQDAAAQIDAACDAATKRQAVLQRAAAAAYKPPTASEKLKAELKLEWSDQVGLCTKPKVRAPGSHVATAKMSGYSAARGTASAALRAAAQKMEEELQLKTAAQLAAIDETTSAGKKALRKQYENMFTLLNTQVLQSSQGQVRFAFPANVSGELILNVREQLQSMAISSTFGDVPHYKIVNAKAQYEEALATLKQAEETIVSMSSEELLLLTQFYGYERDLYFCSRVIGQGGAMYTDAELDARKEQSREEREDTLKGMFAAYEDEFNGVPVQDIVNTALDKWVDVRALAEEDPARRGLPNGGYGLRNTAGRRRGGAPARAAAAGLAQKPFWRAFDEVDPENPTTSRLAHLNAATARNVQIQTAKNLGTTYTKYINLKRDLKVLQDELPNLRNRMSEFEDEFIEVQRQGAGGIEADRRRVLVDAVCAAAFYHEPDAEHVDTNPMDGDDDAVELPPEPPGWYPTANPQRDDTLTWCGRLMRKRAFGEDMDADSAAQRVQTKKSRFDGDVTDPYLSCAYEALMWYFGGIEDLDILPRAETVRMSIMKDLGMKQLEREYVNNPSKIDPERHRADLSTYFNPWDEDKKRFKEIDELTVEQQRRVMDLGHRMFCMNMDTMILATQDAFPNPVLLNRQERPVSAPTRPPQDNSSRSHEWQRAVEHLSLAAQDYVNAACHAGQHNEMFIRQDGTYADLLPSGDPNSISNLAFAMPGQTLPTGVTPADRAPPFTWPQTIWLSKVFSLVEQLAMQTEGWPGYQGHTKDTLTRALTNMHQALLTNQGLGPVANREYQAINVEGKGNCKMPTPPEHVHNMNETFPVATAVSKDMGEEQAEYRTLLETELDQEEHLVQWSIAMEIETNPHAAAAWVVLLHRLLTARFRLPPNVYDASSVSDATTVDSFDSLSLLWDPEVAKERLQSGALASAGAVSNAQNTKTLDRLTSEATSDSAVPNEMGSWILYHPSVAAFLETPMGEYMMEVYHLSRFAWYTRQSRVLECACEWGYKQLALTKYRTGNKQRDLERAALRSNRYHSALNKVPIRLTDGSGVVTAADVYESHSLKYASNHNRTWRTMAKWARSTLTASRQVANYVDPGIFKGVVGAVGWATGLNLSSQFILASFLTGVGKKYMPNSLKWMQGNVKDLAAGLVELGVGGAVDVVQGLSQGTSIVLQGCKKVLSEKLDKGLHPYFFLLNADRLAKLLADPAKTVKMLTDMMDALAIGTKSSWHWDGATRWNNPLSIAMQGLAEMLVKVHEMKVETRYLNSMAQFLGVPPEGCEDLTGRAGPPMEECERTYTWEPQTDKKIPVRYKVTFDQTKGDDGVFWWYDLSSLATALNNVPDDDIGPSAYVANVAKMADSAQNWISNEFYEGLRRTAEAFNKLTDPERIGSAASSATRNVVGHVAKDTYGFAKGVAKDLAPETVDMLGRVTDWWSSTSGISDALKSALSAAQAKGDAEQMKLLQDLAREQAREAQELLDKQNRESDAYDADDGKNTEAEKGYKTLSQKISEALAGVGFTAGTIALARAGFGAASSDDLAGAAAGAAAAAAGAAAAAAGGGPRVNPFRGRI